MDYNLHSYGAPFTGRIHDERNWIHKNAQQQHNFTENYFGNLGIIDILFLRRLCSEHLGKGRFARSEQIHWDGPRQQ